MILKAYISGITNVLLVCASIAIGVYTFNTPYAFEIFSIGILCLLGFIFRHDIDILAVCLILIFNKLAIDIAFYFSVDNAIWRVAAYAVVLTAFWYTKYDRVTKFAAIILAVALIAEVYWAASGISGPEIYFYFYKLAVFLTVRYLLIYRPHGLTIYFEADAKILRIDYIVYVTKEVACYVECIMIAEYLIRSFTSYRPLIIYDVYSYAMQLLGCWMLWLVMMAAKNNVKKTLISA